MELLFQTFHSLGSSDVLVSFSTHTACSERFMSFYVRDVCLRFEEGAVSSCRKYASVCGYFFISFPAPFFSSFLESLFCSTALQWKKKSLPVTFNKTIKMSGRYFCCSLLCHTHFCVFNCTQSKKKKKKTSAKDYLCQVNDKKLQLLFKK